MPQDIVRVIVVDQENNKWISAHNTDAGGVEVITLYDGENWSN